MARGNQRDKAREKNLKEAASAHLANDEIIKLMAQIEQKSKNTMSGTQFQKAKEDAAEIMRRKQAAAEAKKAEGSVAGAEKKK